MAEQLPNEELLSILTTIRGWTLLPDGIRERVNNAIDLLEAQQHDYLSTACYHGLHRDCRKICKFCEANCRCSCHKGSSHG